MNKDPMARIRAEYLKQAADTFDHFTTGKWIESPIEALAVGALLVNEFTHPEQVPWTTYRERFTKLGLMPTLILHRETADFGVGIQVTATIESREVRFDMVALIERVVVVIELDGHDFHERTKAQATRDKRRDRAIALLGWQVARFTGSEVHADPACVADHLTEIHTNESERAWNEYLASRGKDRR